MKQHAYHLLIIMILKKKKYNSVGKACKGVTLKIFKYKKNKQNIGEIGCKTKLLSSMSLDKNKYFKAGFYLTGDLGYIKKNYLYLSGRKKEIIIKSGINIFPSDIQVEVNKNKFINSSFVLGVKDDFFGEVPICICELKEHTLTKDKLEKIKEDINSRLPKTHIPHKYIFLKKIKLLKTGKVDKLYYKKKYQTIRMPNLSNLFIN